MALRCDVTWFRFDDNTFRHPSMFDICAKRSEKHYGSKWL